MKYHDDYDDYSKNKTFTIAAVLSIAAIVCVVVLVLLANANKLKRKVSSVSFVSSDNIETENEISSISSSEKLTVSDLDFYDMYKNEEVAPAISTDTTTLPVEAEPDESTDGKHTLVTNIDGTTEWVAISPNLQKNAYDLTNLVNSAGKYKYFEEDKCVSAFGLDISKSQDYIDFNKLKKAGADFVMIRVASRGYQSGQINADDYFKDNLKRATDAGLEVGVYFVSNAITEDEAREEAQFVIDCVGTYKLTYPIMYVMEYASNDTSRIDKLSKNDKTMIARAFLNKTKEAGFKPMVYGSKEWLLKEVDLSKLIGDYDFCLNETDSELIDYPYKFSMWKYNLDGTIDGISGSVPFIISFIDYTLK